MNWISKTHIKLVANIKRNKQSHLKLNKILGFYIHKEMGEINKCVYIKIDLVITVAASIE